MRQHATTRTLAAAFLLQAWSDLATAEVHLTRDHKPTATVITAAQPTRSAQLAVKELNHYLRKITGTELPVLSDDHAVKGNLVLVGESKYTAGLGLTDSALKKQEYLIKTFPGKLVLMGHDGLEYGKIDYEGTGLWQGWGIDGWYAKPVGTVYAVHDFLRTICGVRWYLPGDLGESIVKQTSLRVPDVDIRRSPSFEHRCYASWAYDLPEKLYVESGEDPGQIRPLAKREKNLFYLRHKDGGAGFVSGHTFQHWGKRFTSTHPEYGALQPDGRRLFRQPCYMSKAAQQQAVEDIKARLRRIGAYEKAGVNPFDRNQYIPLSPNDGEFWCTCKLCAKYFDPAHAHDTRKNFSNGYASNYVWTFNNLMARRAKELAPGKMVGCIAYQDYYLVPDEPTALEDNLAVMLCRTNLTKYGPLFSDYGFKKKDMLAWKQRVQRLYTWEYLLFPQFRVHCLFPAVVPRRVAEAIRFNKKLGVKGSYIQLGSRANIYRYPAAQHLTNYMLMRLLDDVSIDPEQLLDEYYRLFYGPAAEPMRRFDEEMERIFVKDRKAFRTVQVCGANREKVSAEYCWTKMCPPGKLRELAGHYREAAKLAREEPYKGRGALMDKALLQFMKDSSDKTIEALDIKVSAVSDYFENLSGELPGFEDAVWNRTIPLRRFFDTSDGIVEDTTVRVINDDQHLYVLFECRQDDGSIVSKNKERDSYVWNDNFIEIFVDPQTGDTYKHFIVNPAGVVYDAKAKDRSWNSGMISRQGTFAGGWYVIVRIPFEDITPRNRRSAKPHTVWRANFCRTRSDMISTPGQSRTWSPSGGDFHDTTKFGKLVFHK